MFFSASEGEKAATTTREEAQLKDLIEIAIFKQRYLSLASHVYRQRKYHLKTVSMHFVPPPPHVKDESDMRYLFQPLLDQIRKERESMDECTPLFLTKKNADTALSNDASAEKSNKLKQVKWTSQEVGGDLDVQSTVTVMRQIQYLLCMSLNQTTPVTRKKINISIITAVMLKVVVAYTFFVLNDQHSRGSDYIMMFHSIFPEYIVIDHETHAC